MGFSESFDDGEAKAATLLYTRDVVTDLAEALEDFRLILGRDADAGIPDHERDVAGRLSRGGDLDGAAGDTELHGVGEQVEKYLLEGARIGMDEG